MEDTCSTKPISTLLPKKRKPISSRKMDGHDEEEEIVMDGEDEKEEVERRIEALQRIIPGGESLGSVDKLFEQTADYIMALQSQLKAMNTIVSLIQRHRNHNTNFPG